MRWRRLTRVLEDRVGAVPFRPFRVVSTNSLDAAPNLLGFALHLLELLDELAHPVLISRFGHPAVGTCNFGTPCEPGLARAGWKAGRAPAQSREEGPGHGASYRAAVS